MTSRHSVTKALEGAQKGNREAEAFIDQRYRAQLEAVAKKKLAGFGVKKRALDEEDVVQIALDAFFRGLKAGQYPRATNRQSLIALLRTITQNKASNLARDEIADKRGGGRVRGDSANLGPEGEGEPVGNLAVSREPTPEVAAAIEENVHRVTELLGNLPDNLRQLAVLKMRGVGADYQTATLGRKMLLHNPEKDIWVSGMLAKGLPYEPFETQWIQYLVRPGDVVLDIGAHIGYYTLLFSRLVGEQGKVYAFEPDPANFALLQQNVVLNGCTNVVLYNLALSNRAGTMALFLSGDNAGDHRVWQPDEYRPSVTVQAIALDEFLGAKPFRVDFVKMDVQGAEGAALKGMKRLLRQQPRMAMVTEFWPFGLKRAGSSAGEFEAHLAELNLDFFLIDERQRRLMQVPQEDLTKLLDPEKDVFTNLLCTKRPAV